MAIVTRGCSPALRRSRRGERTPSSARASASIASMAERTFVKFTFLKIDPAWQRREGEAEGAG